MLYDILQLRQACHIADLWWDLIELVLLEIDIILVEICLQNCICVCHESMLTSLHSWYMPVALQNSLHIDCWNPNRCSVNNSGFVPSRYFSLLMWKTSDGISANEFPDRSRHCDRQNALLQMERCQAYHLPNFSWNLTNVVITDLECVRFLVAIPFLIYVSVFK